MFRDQEPHTTVNRRVLVDDYDLGQAPVSFSNSLATGFDDAKFAQMPMARPYGEKNYVRSDVNDEENYGEPVPAENIYRTKNQASTSLNLTLPRDSSESYILVFSCRQSVACLHQSALTRARYRHWVNCGKGIFIHFCTTRDTQ